MAKVTTRKETGKLVIDFTYRGVRCREQTALANTPANRKVAQTFVQRINAALAGSAFVYSDFFPSSPLAIRFSAGATTPIAAAVSPAMANSAGSAMAAAAMSSSQPFREAAAQWLKAHEVEWRRSHRVTLRSTVEGHLNAQFGDRLVHTITKADVLALRAHLATLPGRGGKPALSNRRINGILAPLRQILRDAEEEFGFASPMTNLKPLKVRKTDVEPFTLDQVQQIVSTVRIDYRDYFTVRFFTGMRTGEAHGLKWKYVDFDNRLILIRETFVLGEDEYTKTDSSQRDIQMTQVVYEALKRQFEATGKIGEYVFCNRGGQPLDNKNFSDRVWYPLLRHMGLKLRRPYQMRHTAATLWLASGEAPEWIARQLGHSSTEMLFRVYSRFVPNLTRRDGSAIDRLLATRFSSGKPASTDADDKGAAGDAKPDPSKVDRRPPAQPPP